MSRERWFLSALVVYHIIALALSSLPSREAMERYDASLSDRQAKAIPSKFFDRALD